LTRTPTIAAELHPAREPHRYPAGIIGMRGWF
jgi:hypothetical protein